MDNLTHSLAGAVLGQMGLKRKTALAMPTLIIAANIPDIDAAATLLGGVTHLALRRGLTHGPIAMLVLPILLTGIMLAYDGYKRRRNAARPAVHKGWLLALAFVGTLSHPALDWLNSYGVRLLEPFSSKWFYGDSIFIIDIWIWAALILSVWVSLRRERRAAANWQRPAWIGFAAICAYIFANGLITGRAEGQFTELVAKRTGQSPSMVVANPVPVTFWKREMMWRNERDFGGGWFSLFDRPYLRGKYFGHGMTDPQVAQMVEADAAARDFLFWSRMPIVARSTENGETRLSLRDQRFDHELTRGRFEVQLRPKAGMEPEAPIE